jgi:glycerol-3-phosphate acyltransferase PlsY
VFDEFVIVQKVLASVVVGYLLGSVPFAHLAARRKGVDIFTTGSRRAGTANVFWNIGRRRGIVVFGADVAKGGLAVAVAVLLGLSGPLVIIAGGAAVVGHWKSIFTGFRGGDGMATLTGVTVAVVPLLALLGIVAGVIAVLTLWKSPFRSAAGIASCFIILLAVSHYFPEQRDLVLGLTVLATLVLFHNILIHRRLDVANIRKALDLALEDEDDLDDDPDLGQTAPENQSP